MMLLFNHTSFTFFAPYNVEGKLDCALEFTSTGQLLTTPVDTLATAAVVETIVTLGLMDIFFFYSIHLLNQHQLPNCHDVSHMSSKHADGNCIWFLLYIHKADKALSGKC